MVTPQRMIHGNHPNTYRVVKSSLTTSDAESRCQNLSSTAHYLAESAFAPCATRKFLATDTNNCKLLEASRGLLLDAHGATGHRPSTGLNRKDRSPALRYALSTRMCTRHMRGSRQEGTHPNQHNPTAATVEDTQHGTTAQPPAISGHLGVREALFPRVTYRRR